MSSQSHLDTLASNPFITGVANNAVSGAVSGAVAGAIGNTTITRARAKAAAAKAAYLAASRDYETGTHNDRDFMDDFDTLTYNLVDAYKEVERAEKAVLTPDPEWSSTINDWDSDDEAMLKSMTQGGRRRTSNAKYYNKRRGTKRRRAKQHRSKKHRSKKHRS